MNKVRSTVFRALACCDTPLPGRAIKLFFFSPSPKQTKGYDLKKKKKKMKYNVDYKTLLEETKNK